MNNRTKGALAGVAGVAILAGGTTFALWSDSDEVDGGVITSGNLAVAAHGDSVWKDISADRTDSPHSFDLTADKVVPGDTIQGTFGIDAALEGDNIVADLGLALDGVDLTDQPELLDGLDITYTLRSAGGSAFSGATDVPLGTEAQVQFASEDNSNPGGLPTLPADLGGDADLEVVVTVTFEDQDGRDLVKSQADLQNLGITLDQVREDAPGYNG
ncbi:alternate-type signal peptide domain-containing protein [Georgenia sp. SUBG003]|uniref:alternate-type signal peptide domain-containing protein n=1 Tax=Georgenia sp. SUBG003 TaxID=1497974 RepID=UPI000693A770